jgi:bisanhydrobacterioruberin hydratase
MTIIQRINEHKLPLSIFLVWLFHVSAIVGIWLGHADWFLPLTPLNLLLCFGLLLWNIPNLNKQDMFLLLVPFSFGMLAEWLGVNFGLIFGEYAYGNNLGPKIWGVPWMIGINWAILVFLTASIAQKISKNLLIASTIGAILMVLLDLIIEQVAPQFDFWEFNDNIVPLQNYVGWYVVAFLAHLIYQKFFSKHQYTFSLWTFFAFIVFFGVFAFV